MSTSGTEYLGAVSEGKDGKQCEYWNNTNLSSYWLSIISDMNENLYGDYTAYTNQCRNIGNESYYYPWCYDKNQQAMPCNIPYCGLHDFLFVI